MGGWFAALGQAAAGQAVSGGIAMGMQRLGSKYDRRMNKKLQQQQLGIQMQGEKQMMDYQQQKQLEMWEKTGYGPQVEQMKKAGINPALMYGMGGGGAQTVGAAGSPSVQGGAPYTNTAPIGMGMQNIAEIRLMEAQAKNIETDTQLKLAGIPKTGAETENIKAQTELTRIHREIAQVQASVARQTINDQMTTIENAAKKGTQEIINLKLDAEKTKQETTLLEKEIAQMAIKSALLQAQKENVSQDTKNKIQEILESEQRMKSMASAIMIAWDKLSLETTENRIKWDDALDKDEGFNIIKELVPTFLIPIGRGFKQGHTPIKGFQR